MSTRKSSIMKAILTFIFLSLTWLAETFSGVFSVRQAVRFGKGEENDVYEMDIWTWLTLGISAVGAFFYVATMLFAASSKEQSMADLSGNSVNNEESEVESEAHEKTEEPDDHEETDSEKTSEKESVKTSNGLYAKHSDNKRCHVFYFLKEGGEFMAVAIPFALLAYGSSLPFWNMIESKLGISGMAYAISVTSGLADGVGNGILHTHHFEAEEGICILFKSLEGRYNKIKAGALGISVLMGHLAQGGLDGYAFLNTFSKINLLAELAISGGLGVAVTACEGHTEMRSTLWYEKNKASLPKHLSSRVILFLPSALHGLQPGIGPIILLEMLYKILTSTALVNDLNLATRLSILAVSIALIGYPNAQTFERTVLPATTKIVGKVTSFFNCNASFFGNEGSTAEETGSLTSEPTTPYHRYNINI